MASCEGMKTSWPELVGEEGEIARATIETEVPWIEVVIVSEGAAPDIPLDYRCDRVWIWLNRRGIVTTVPLVA
ncbi:Proteinase inhibitor I13, potato inhibitor I [Corchorus olitorius]|uniref:Proteinase inhibitor I13, potato inhibitor I n=1 Tax=Corchorus olitorius TaxID=93759 RepID=A0A1R3FUR4_9ROSI|nr:Proteinase inhibitor I13, potato inhibitor I [Corchorus olitorius]